VPFRQGIFLLPHGCVLSRTTGDRGSRDVRRYILKWRARAGGRTLVRMLMALGQAAIVCPHAGNAWVSALSKTAAVFETSQTTKGFRGASAAGPPRWAWSVSPKNGQNPTHSRIRAAQTNRIFTLSLFGKSGRRGRSCCMTCGVLDVFWARWVVLGTRKNRGYRRARRYAIKRSTS